MTILLALSAASVSWTLVLRGALLWQRRVLRARALRAVRTARRISTRRVFRSDAYWSRTLDKFQRELYARNSSVIDAIERDRKVRSSCPQCGGCPMCEAAPICLAFVADTAHPTLCRRCFYSAAEHPSTEVAP